MRPWKDKVRELLADPIAGLLLQRDGLDRDEVIRDMEAVVARLRNRRPEPTGKACAICEIA